MSGSAIAAMALIKQRVELSGTAGTPNFAQDVKTFPDDAFTQWRFLTTGELERTPGGYAPDPYEWYFPEAKTPQLNSHWLRATVHSGDTPTSYSGLNTWLSMNSALSFSWLETGLGTLDGVLKIEIATDAGGTNIVATGYYRGISVVESGA